MTTSAPDPAGLDVRHFCLHILKPVLAFLGDGHPGIESRSAVELLLGTAAQESGFRALDQITGPNDRTLGPALGLYQIEPDTLIDLHNNYLRFRPPLADRLSRIHADWPSAASQLVGNLPYATAVARLIYFRSSVRLAAPGDIPGHAEVWKRVYNTAAGKGREEDFVANYRRLVAPHVGDIL